VKDGDLEERKREMRRDEVEGGAGGEEEMEDRDKLDQLCDC